MAYVSEIFCSVQGEGPWAGERQIFVRFGGCDVRCRWCDTPDSLARGASCDVRLGERRLVENPVGESDIREWIDRAMGEERARTVSFTGGEPLLQAEAIRAICDGRAFIAHLETGGHRPRELAAVIGRVDRVSLDIKLPSSTGDRALWDEHIESLRVLKQAGTECYIKCIVTRDTDAGEIERAARLTGEFLSNGHARPFVIQPVTAGHGAAAPTGGQLSDWQKLALAHLPDVRILPQIHPALGLP